MAYRIEITSTVSDTRASVRKAEIKNLGFKTKNVFLVDVYTIDKKLSAEDLQKISKMLVNPITQKVSFTSPLFPEKFRFAFEIGFLPGVTDNIGNTAQEAIEDLLGLKFQTNEGVYSSQITFVDGKISQNQIQKIAENLANTLIMRIHIKNAKEFHKQNGMDKVVPRVKLKTKPKADIVNLNVSDDELIKIGKQGIANSDGSRRGPLALDLTYMKTTQSYFNSQKRSPTDIEIESIAQTWSEHCKHTIFADPIDDIKDGLYKTYIKKATEEIRQKKSAKSRSNSVGDFCISVFTDNSGAISFDENYLITDKVETHNSPSALDPFGGSITGIGGVNRDTIGFGKGAKPILNRYGFCFADPNDQKPLYKGPNKTQKMLSPRRIMDGVIKGVNVGGNCSGIPTPQGFVVFNDCYKGKPLVFVGTVGLLPKKIAGQSSKVKKAKAGDYIVMIGGRVGKDGIHGATFSSEAMDTGSPATAVQIGDPITQKKLSDAVTKEANRLNLFNSITDNGAGGLSCSVAEMAKECGGCLVDLDKVPLKYAGLDPWEIWISESQERMTLAVPKNKWKKLKDLMTSRGVEATRIGKFTDSGNCIVKFHGKTIMNVNMQFLHDGLPARPMQTTYTQPVHEEPKIKNPKNLTKIFLSMLSRQNIASFAFISSQYDHEVQGSSVLKPLQGRGQIQADATIIKPVLLSRKGVVVSHGINPQYSSISTYDMAACAIDTAVRNAICVGVNIDHLALLDNFCWCSSNEPERLGQLKQAARACYDYSTIYETPFISGKDSMFNDFKGFDESNKPLKISILPTLLISALGVIDDVKKAVSLDVKFAGDLIYVLGETYEEMGASEYYAMMGEQKGKKYIGNSAPKVSAEKNIKLYRALADCIKNKMIVSAVSVRQGGLGVALAKTAMAGMLGIDVSFKKLPGKFSRDDFALFSESQGRIVVTVNPENKKIFERALAGNSFANIGKVTKKPIISIQGKKGCQIVKTTVQKALKEYRKTFKEY